MEKTAVVFPDGSVTLRKRPERVVAALTDSTHKASPIVRICLFIRNLMMQIYQILMTKSPRVRFRVEDV